MTNENETKIEAEVIPEESKEDGQIPLAGVGRRFLALLIDALLLSIISKIVRVVPILNVMPFIMYLLFLVYSAWFESSKYRGTLGKIALGIEVTDMAGRTISLKTAVLRAIGKVISALIMLIGFLFAFFTERKQTLHDLIAKTVVVTSPKEQPAEE